VKDLLVVIVTLLFFLVCWAYVRGLQRL